MNSKALFLLMILFGLLSSSCGVKSDPVYPAGTEIPAYEQKFLKVAKEKAKEKAKKKEKN